MIVLSKNGNSTHRLVPEGTTAKLGGIAAGVEDNDAVNVKQLTDTMAAGLTTLVADSIIEKTVDHGINVDGVLLLDGTITSGQKTVKLYSLFTPSNYTASQAIATISYLNSIDSTAGALAMTINNAAVKGTVIKIILFVKGGNVTLTGTLKIGTGDSAITSIVLSAVNQFVELMWDGAAWITIDYNAGVTINL